MDMLKIAICDDEKACCMHLEESILKYAKYDYLEVSIEVFSSGEELLKYLKSGNVIDLLFLDIEMDGINGVEVGLHIREKKNDYKTEIVYVTSKEGYEKKLFAVQPLYFLEKTVEFSELGRVLDLTKKRLDLARNYFEYSVQRTEKRIPVSDILYFESKGHDVVMVANDRIEVFHDNLKDVMNRVQGRFHQVHRAYCVNFDYIRELNGDNVVMVNGVVIPLGRVYRDELRKAQMKYKRVRGGL